MVQLKLPHLDTDTNAEGEKSRKIESVVEKKGCEHPQTTEGFSNGPTDSNASKKRKKTASEKENHKYREQRSTSSYESSSKGTSSLHKQE